MEKIFTLLFLILTSFLFGQEIQYVKADNGLIVRDQPSKNGTRIGKLKYGTVVEVREETAFELTIRDGQKEISGKWVRVLERDGYLKGYVFSGYLTSEELSKRTELKFPDYTIQMEFETYGPNEGFDIRLDDTIVYYMDLGETPEGKRIRIKQSKFKKVELFQQHENSLTIMNEGAHCDLLSWEHYYSDWEKMELDSLGLAFVSRTYSSEDWLKFIDVDMKALKQAVEKECGVYMLEHLGDIKRVDEYPCGVSMSRIFFKLRLTDNNDSVTEKIIEFEIPMGC